MTQQPWAPAPVHSARQTDLLRQADMLLSELGSQPTSVQLQARQLGGVWNDIEIGPARTAAEHGVSLRLVLTIEGERETAARHQERLLAAERERRRAEVGSLGPQCSGEPCPDNCSICGDPKAMSRWCSDCLSYAAQDVEVPS